MVLIVYAHHEPTSFNRALLDTACKTLTEAGHAVEITNLYALNFEARASRADFKEMRDPTRFDYAGNNISPNGRMVFR